MTMSNNEMIALFPDVIACMSIYDIEIKKMCFLYLLTYAKAKPKIAIEAIPVLIDDLTDSSPLIRALALRTMSAIPVREYFDTALEYTRELLHDNDPYVRKTAAYSVAKLWNADPKAVEKIGLIDDLNKLLANNNPTVVAASLAALMDITEKSEGLDLAIDRSNAFNLAHILPDVNEWSQIYILNALMNFVPQKPVDATLLIERVIPRLQFANSSVVLGTIRLIIYLTNFVPNLSTAIPNLDRRIGPALVTLLSKPPEIQYLALRNCILLLQSRKSLLNLDVRVFFSKYNDPIYVKATKLEIIFLLADENNIGEVLRELRECATEIDVQVARKAVRAIGKLAIKVEAAAQPCIEALLELVSTKISYIVQEATVVIKNIFRRYPNRYESVISALCDNLDSLDEPEAKSAMIWIIGQYADRIDNSHELLDGFLSTFTDEPVSVQLSLLTAVVKLFILRPTKGQGMVPKILKMATEDSDNPDLRDRAYMYWRLLSSDPAGTKKVVLDAFPEISADSDRMDDERLEELELAIGTLATVYLKPVKQVFRTAKVRKLPISPALAPREQTKSLAIHRSQSFAEQEPPRQQVQRAATTPASGANIGVNISPAPVVSGVGPSTRSNLADNMGALTIDTTPQPWLGANSTGFDSPLSSNATPTTASFNYPQSGIYTNGSFNTSNVSHINHINQQSSHHQDLIQLDDPVPLTPGRGYVVTQNGLSGGNQDLLW
ncbi:Apl1p [Sugiyamaella lignohabitans]|uniref:AP complex subunit beta n=1 Tax=Sugiyamaella lignohabitans TaxID=796027 RepID=A0A167FLI5_9ASCO|nr:Apl1p [Sugiyamaella lignohabitans]ANB15453.1 Apl1p [Sugiyamaella lignohabitans]